MLSDDVQREERLSQLLVQYDLQLAGATLDEQLDASVVESDSELASEWHEAKHCLELLDRVRRHWSPEEPPDERVDDTFNLLRSALATPPIGPATTLGRFRVLHELGRGGLGVVYLAHDPKLGRQVALKVPRIEVLASEDMRRRFLREAEAAARLSHPHVVAIHEAGEEGPICYIATEYCHGPTLAQWLKERNRPLPIELAAQMAMQLATAVQHAHGRGVLHRDIKPSNILLVRLAEVDPRSDSGQAPETAPAAAAPIQVQAFVDSQRLCPKLTDFGMAKLLESAADETRSGVLIGTPAYMSPEQAQGRVRELDARSDVYGLGTVLYELLTGQRPHQGESDVEVLRRVLFEDPIAPRRLRPKIPRDLEAIALRCLAKRPEARYATAQQLADDLQRFLSGQPTEARPPSVAGRVLKWARRRPAVAALVSVVALSALTLLGVVIDYNARLKLEVVRADQAREHAQHEAEVSRQLLYAGDIRLAHEAYKAHNVPLMLSYLDQQIPQTGQSDLRGFAWYYLRGLSEQQVQTLRGHQDEVFSVAYSPDGRRLATASKDRTVRVWDAATGRELRVLNGHATEVTCVAWSPDGKLLASGSEDHTIRFWDPSTGEPLAVLEGNTDHVLSIAFSPDGQALASGGRDLIVRVWDVEQRTVREALNPRKATVTMVAFSPDGSLLLAADEAGEVSCWITRDYQTWKKGGDASEPSKLLALAFSRITPTVAAAGRFRSIHVWDWDAQQGMSRRRSLQHHILENIQCLAFSPAEETLAFAAKDGSTTLWSFNDPKFTEPQLLRTIVGHTARVWSLSWSPDGRHLATASSDHTVKIWHAQYGNGIAPLPVADHDLHAIDISPDGSKLATGGTEGYLQVLDLPTRRLRTKRTLFDGKSNITAIRYSPDGKRIAVSSHPDCASIIDAQTLEVQHEFSWPGSGMSTLAWSPDGQLILLSGGDNTLHMIDSRSGETRWKLASEILIGELAFSPDGERFAVISSQMKLYSTRTGELLRTFDEADRLAFSPDGQILVSSRLGVVTFWDAHTFRKLRALKPKPDRINLLRFAPGGQVLVTAPQQPRVTLWDVRTGQELLEFEYEDPGKVQLTDLAFADAERLFGVGWSRSAPRKSQGHVWEWRAPREGSATKRPKSLTTD